MARIAHSIQAHHYNPESLINPADWFISRKWNGWCFQYEPYSLVNGLTYEKVPWFTKSTRNDSLKDLRTTGMWTIGRGESGPTPIYPPKWWRDQIVECFGFFPVQGELVHGSDKVEMVKSIVGQVPVKSIADPRWEDMRFIACNMKPFLHWRISSWPDSEYYKPSDWPYQKVLAELQRLVVAYERKKPDTVIQLIKQNELETTQAKLENYLHDALRSNPTFEGFMLIKKDSTYIPQRTFNLLKVKRHYEDSCIVVGYVDGKKANEGRIGSLTCSITWTDKILSIVGGSRELIGKTVNFGVSGLTQMEREIPPKIGSVIHVGFIGVTDNGTPISCNIYRGISET